jgi:membrane protease YdiL (CAAX protease family)
MPKDTMKKPLLFILITFLLSWSLSFGYFALGGETYRPSWFAIAILSMFTPMLAALIVQKGVYRQQVLSPLGVSFRINKWFVVAWTMPPLIAVAATCVSLLFPGVRFSLDPSSTNLFEFFGKVLPEERIVELQRQLSMLPVHPFLLALFGGMIAGATVNAIAGFGEELGWRGLLQKEVAWLGFWKSSLVIGLVWGLWHSPFIIHGYDYPDHPIAGIFMMTLWTVLFSPLIAYVRIKAKSVIAAAVMHGSLNGTAIVPAIVIRGGDSLTVGVMGIAGIFVLVLLNMVLFWLLKKQSA